MSVIAACCGDIIGSRFEGINNVTQPNFRLFTKLSRFTDDTVLTVATADAIMKGVRYSDAYRAYYQLYPHAGYGGMFKSWARSKSKRGYNSFGNGSAMRVSPIAYAYNKLPTVLKEAEKSSMVTHNHEDAVRGAKAVAATIFLARHGIDKTIIKDAVEKLSGYSFGNMLNSQHYGFDVSASGSVPHAINIFLTHNGFENIVRQAVLLGGDSDTIASIAGAIAGAYYGVPKSIEKETLEVLDALMRIKVDKFTSRFVSNNTKIESGE